MIALTPNSTIQQIQRALSSSREVTFTKGKYIITQTLYLHSNTTLIMESPHFVQGAKIHNMFMSYTKYSTTRYNGIHDLIIKGNCTIEGMSKYKTKLNLMTLWHAKDCFLEGINFVDVSGFHHLELNGCKNVTVKDCGFYGYNSMGETAFRESCQLDNSSCSAIFVHPSGSACYDNTPCTGIKFINCKFGKSNSFPASQTGIGNHCQFTTKSDDILISNCNFAGNGIGIRLVGMNYVTIDNCTMTRCDRAIYLTNYGYTYNSNGNKLKPSSGDGACDNVKIKGLKVLSPTGKYKGYRILAKKCGGHEYEEE